jgi:hypothetical protein
MRKNQNDFRTLDFTYGYDRWPSEAFQWAAKKPDTYLKSIGFRDRSSFNRWHKSLVATERAVWRQAVAERKSRIT